MENIPASDLETVESLTSERLSFWSTPNRLRSHHLKQYITETQRSRCTAKHSRPEPVAPLADQPAWATRILGRESMWDNWESNLHTSRDVLRIGPVSGWLEIPISIGFVPYVAGHRHLPDSW